MYLYPLRRAHQMSSHYPPTAAAADSPPTFVEASAWPNNHRQILYNLDLSPRNFKYYQFSINCPQRWKSRKILSVGRENDFFSSKFNFKYIEMIPVKSSTAMVFSLGNFNFFNFRWIVHKDEKCQVSGEKM